MGSEEELRYQHDEGKYKPLGLNTEESSEDTRICLGRLKVPRDPMEITSMFSLASLAFGIILIGIGFGIPRDYTLDPDDDAETKEDVERYYAKLSKQLDILIVVGLGFVGVSALLMASIVMFLLCHNKKAGRDRSDSNASSIGPSSGVSSSYVPQQETSLLSSQSQPPARQYGTQPHMAHGFMQK